MSRLSMVIADEDPYYVESLGSFLSRYYRTRIQSNCFTASGYLNDYLDKKEQKTDILLISPSLLKQCAVPRDTGLIAVLSSGRLERDSTEYGIISKYQTGDRLMSTVLNLYTEKYPDEVYMTDCHKTTKAVAVFSPIGGSGKSTVAVALASAFADRGRKALYLNMENIQATSAFFDCSGRRTLSDILYFFKDKSDALGLKLEAVKQVDPVTGVHYFCPPESVTDLEEFTPEELRGFIDRIKNLNGYDVVIVDLPNHLDRRRILMMDACDQILILTNPDTISGAKLQAAAKEFEIIESRMEMGIIGKCTVVMNKDRPSAGPEYKDIRFCGKPVAHRIPKIPALKAEWCSRCTVNMSDGFGEAIGELVKIILGGIS